ncbi:MAG: aspartate-semialdehyde dehydrogenase [Chlamydiales bacterium]|jgi:aspartate-semialdehyde dehydrogenase|nr:aspartate-semialdehyde dehydrogenase [Chlamydiales bacterium]
MILLYPPVKIAVVGATGLVGREVLNLLEKRRFPIQTLRCFASVNSKDACISFSGEKIPLEILSENTLQNIDLALFCTKKEISSQWIPYLARQKTIIIDNSSAFRLDPDVPLIIPEINLAELANHNYVIASPNCSASIMLMALFPLHQHTPIQRIQVATYQAVSGAGFHAMQEFISATQAALEKKPYTPKALPFPSAFNLFLHNSTLNADGYVDEELKMLQETRKILSHPHIQVNATCVRVPVLRAHSQALNVTFTQEICPKKAYELLEKAPGIKVYEERLKNRFPMPIDAAGQNDVYCGRIRKDLSCAHTLDLWIVGDQILKGAALNAVQIAEHLI